MVVRFDEGITGLRSTGAHYFGAPVLVHDFIS